MTNANRTAVVPESCLSTRLSALSHTYVLSIGILLSLLNVVQYIFLGWSNGYLSIIYFSLIAAITLVSNKWGLLALVFILPISPGLHLQLNSIFGLTLKTFSHPGLDATIGFLSAYTFGLLLKKRPSQLEKYAPIFPTAFHLFLIFSTTVAISRNIWQSGSSLSVKGFLYNVAILRTLGWHADYFPLKDLFSYSIALCLFNCALIFFRNERNCLQSLVRSLLASSLVLGIFGVIQHFFSIGFANSGFDNGINSFFPDLHSYAAFLVLPTFAIFFYYRSCKTPEKLAVFGIQLLSLYNIFLSGSRFTIFITFPLMVIVAIFYLFRHRPTYGWVAGGIALVGLFISYHYLSETGLRGMKTQELRTIFGNESFEYINRVLSYRPELAREAIRMFLDFPIFGLGQGELYKTGSIASYSTSSLMLNMHGENAHNYVLQTLAELGLVGMLAIGLIFCLPFVTREPNKDIRLSAGLIFAMFLGNIFAHSLLEREVLIVFSIITALFYYETGYTDFQGINQLTQKIFHTRTMKVLSYAALVLLAVLGTQEVAHSFYKAPFTYGLTCFQNTGLTSDNWTSGLFKRTIPPLTEAIKLEFEHGHQDVGRRPLNIDFEVVDEKGEIATKIQKTYTQEGLFQLELFPKNERPNELVIKTSRCFVPVNLGVNIDSRHLGINIKKIDFWTKGKETAINLKQ